MLPRIARSPSSPRAIDGGGKIHSSSSRSLLWERIRALSFQASAQKIKFYCCVRSPHRCFLTIFLFSWRPSHVALSRPSPRPLRLPHLKFDCCVGRVGRVPIDLGLVASNMVIDSSPHPPGDARDFIHRAIRGNHVIPSQWCWFGAALASPKNIRMRALSSLRRNISKQGRGREFRPYFCRPFA